MEAETEEQKDARLRLGLLNTQETAKVLTISPRKLYELTRDKEIPHLRMGSRCVRYEMDSLKKWIASKVQGGET
tara:strand:- start:1949 stop:2170 length:222 start_codon:yes stop_codon:yes gene_type:complete